MVSQSDFATFPNCHQTIHSFQEANCGRSEKRKHFKLVHCKQGETLTDINRTGKSFRKKKEKKKKTDVANEV